MLAKIKALFHRPSTFEVLKNTANSWFWHERAANGKIKSVSEAYATRYNAIRAAQKKVDETPGAKLRVLD